MRQYALTRIDKGDYLCASNDGATLWRFQRYHDGRGAGLDVDYDWRAFWKASQTPMPPGGVLDVDDVDDLPWREWHTWLPTRKAALRSVFGDDE